MCIALLLGLNVSAAALGSMHPFDPMLAGFATGCDYDPPQPCWHGIVMGKTTEAESQRILERENYVLLSDSGFFVSYAPAAQPADTCQKIVLSKGGIEGQMFIFDIIFSRCSGVRSGDLMRVLGTPASINMSMPTIAYGTGLTNVIFSVWSDTWNTSPFEPINSIRLGGGFGDMQIYDWHGFMPEWRYCQLETAHPSCD